MLPSEVAAAAEKALSANEAQRGLQLADHLLRSFPGHLRARTIRARALLALGDDEGAAGDAATVLSVDLLNVDAMLVSAKLAEARGDLHQSHALIGRAASIEPGHSGVRKAAAESVALLPRGPSALGFMYLGLGWPDLAEREFRVALGRDSARVDLRIGLAESLWQQGRHEEAHPECRTVLDHNPKCLRATLMMAHILAEQGRTAHSVDLLEQAGELDPEYTVAADLYAKASLSRMRLPPPPSIPEPPPFANEAEAKVATGADATGQSETDHEDDQAAPAEKPSPDIFVPVTDAAPEDAEEETDGAPTDEAPDPPPVTAEVPAARPIETTEDATGDAVIADGATPESGKTSPTPGQDVGSEVAFAAGWPAAASEPKADADPSVAPPTVPVEIEPATLVAAVETTDAAAERADRQATEDSAEDDLADEPVEDSSIDAAVAEAPVPRRPADADAEPESAGSTGEKALIEMGRLGGWDAVVEALEKLLASGETDTAVATIAELVDLAGFRTEIWRLLGDHHMRNQRPRLASEAYFRAVRRSSS